MAHRPDGSERHTRQRPSRSASAQGSHRTLSEVTLESVNIVSVLGSNDRSQIEANRVWRRHRFMCNIEY